jgi:protein PET100
MGGRLEVFKFAIYIFFPVGMMYHFGNPYWYIDNVLPFRDKLFPPESRLNRPPKERGEIQDALEAYKDARRKAKTTREAAAEVEAKMRGE